MGLFRKKPDRSNSIRAMLATEEPDNPPPVFNKHDEAHRLKGYNPRRRASLEGSSMNSSSKRSLLDHQTIKNDLVIPPFKKKGPFVSEQAVEEYVEEEEEVIFVEEDEYIEEVIIEDDDEYFEEEIIEEDVLPPREIKIMFDDYDEMQTTIHINDYSDSELNKSWFKREDYDKMVATAKKLVETEKEGKKLAAGQDTRGLEAWRDSVAIRALKERAIEAVWNEQSRQWEKGENDPEKMRQVYRTISEGAQETAMERAKQDEAAAAAIRRDAMRDDINQKRRGMMAVGKALGKSVRATTRVAGKTGRVLGRTGLGVATFDGRMIKESIGANKKSRTAVETPKITRQPSLGARKLMELDNSLKFTASERGGSVRMTLSDKFHCSTPVKIDGTSSLSFDVNDTKSVGSRSVGSLNSIQEDAPSVMDTSKRKAQKLKLLGLVPIPGTKKMYEEDIQRKRIEDRRSKMTRMPSWESGLSTGKY